MRTPGNFTYLTVLIGLALAIPAHSAEIQQAATVDIDKVISEPNRQTVPVLGRLVATRISVVAARSRGPVLEMRVKVGDRVVKGEILSVLVKDRSHWEHQLRLAEVEEKKAALKTATTHAELKTQEMMRLKGLQKSAAFPQGRFDDLRQEVTKANSISGEKRAALQRARANLKLAEINLDNTEIRAPFAGVIAQRHTEAGAYLAAGQAVVTLIDDQTIEIEADVPAQRISGLSSGTTVSVRLGETRNVTAKVRAVVPRENPLTRTLTVRFTPLFDVIDGGYAINQSVTIFVPTGGTENAVTVHKDAVLVRRGNTVVFLSIDGKATIRPVQLGEATGVRFIVKSGLRPGDMTVIRGNERLRPGQALHHQGAPDNKPDSGTVTK